MRLLPALVFALWSAPATAQEPQLLSPEAHGMWQGTLRVNEAGWRVVGIVLAITTRAETAAVIPGRAIAEFIR